MQNKSPDIPVPKDPRHLKFADLVLNGEQPSKAYKMAGYNAKTLQSRSTAAGRLLKNVEVSRYLDAMRKEACKGKVLTLQAKREFLARVVLTPLLSIDPHGPDGDLIVKYKNTVTEEGGVVDMVKVDPLKAIDLDNKLSGDDPESNATAGLAAAIAGLGALGAMSETM